MKDCKTFLEHSRDRVNKALAAAISQQSSVYAAADTPQLSYLLEACEYSISNGGKRLRPALIYATAEALSTSIDDGDLDLIAAAVECIHSYSLVHDDLPAMDDDELRRGKPTCHIAYDEATAILVGDGLQALAFELITQTRLKPAVQIALVKSLAQAAGNFGMVGGQCIDLQAADKAIDVDHLEQMHSLKTGALIRSSVAFAAIACEADAKVMQSLDTYASDIGLAFQVQDDILDIESDTETLGKTQGADEQLNKPTYPALLGMELAKQKANDLVEDAHKSLKETGLECSILHELADFIIARRH